MGALKSLYAHTNIEFDLYVVVNNPRGEDDPQVQVLKEEFPDAKLVIYNHRRPYATNHNDIMLRTDSEYVLLLNDDIHIHEGAIDTLVAYMDEHPEVGLCGPRLFNPDGSEQVAVYSDPGLLRVIYKVSGLAVLTNQFSGIRRTLVKYGLLNWLKIESLKSVQTTRYVDVVKGAVNLVRREVIETVGGMDESIPIYGEEPDWNGRMRQAGWQAAFVGEAHITHFGQGQVKLRLQPHVIPMDRKSILNYFIKHRPRWQVLIVRAAIIISHTFWGTFWLPFSSERSKANYQTAAIGWRWHRKDIP